MRLPAFSLTATSMIALLALAACSGGEKGIRLLADDRTVSVPDAVDSVSTYRCESAVENGSAAQVACHEAARMACPEGTRPDHVQFQRRDDGQFLIEGYGCV